MTFQSAESVLPQPREGVTGTNRTGDVLLVSDAARELVASLTGRLRVAVLYGERRVPDTQAVCDRLSNPVPGDLVVVLDGIRSRDLDDRRKGFGYLITHRREWACTDEVWAQSKAVDLYLTDDDRVVEPDAWYIQYGPNPADIVRWTNCDVIAVPPAGA